MKHPRWWQLGELNGNAVLRRHQIRSIRKLHRRGWTQREIARFFGVWHSTVHAVLVQRTWGWLT